MKSSRAFVRRTVCVFAGMSMAAAAWAATPNAASDTASTHSEPKVIGAANALLPDTESFVIDATPNGPRYRIWLYHPASSVSGRPQPLLVLLDGNATFALAVSAARLQAKLIGPVTIAAIAADNDALFDESQRFRDFTTPARDGWGVPNDAQGKPLDTGGAQAFETFVNETLPRAIEARTQLAPRARMLFGHSLGGYFVLNDALAHPQAYSRYMAASPSIWWNGAELLANVRASAQSSAGKNSHHAQARIPLAIRIGGDEQKLAPNAPPARVERVTHAAMLDNARTFADLLHTTPALGFDADLQIYAGQNHVSYLPAAISEAVALAARSVP
ncbi:alpha/beta hydrolase [Paraburkholderia tropica]|nr:alpha/beta hydrolase-fold protein [Paraburkholderia tropica]MBB3001419.1 hypothetical protein [Paraburkholderia tropica]MBB6323305.1 hypothetical protein [Paraburkholderia tropica]